ncbi:MAG TPA: TetR/AcrR family transcriptional regulator [Clostridia bacterium]|nr:TetR/AcrR family transcriptional regulator [Clostridia bacterium]
MAYRKTRKVREQLAGKKETILKAAKEVLAEESTGRASIKKIAGKAGIATGTFYLYFPSKEKLLETIIDEMYKKLLDNIKSERARANSLYEKLQFSMEACIRLFVQEKKLAKILLIQIPGVSAAINRKLVGLENHLVNLTKKDLDELQEQGLIPAQDTLTMATAFVGTFRQVITSWLREGRPEDPEEFLATLIQYNLRGLGKDGEK